MSKKKDTFMNMVISLFVITIISGFSLGYVNQLTEQPIKDAKVAKKTNAIKLVLPDFDNNPVEDVVLIKSENINDSIEVYPGFANNEFVGAAVIGSSEKGFSGLVKLMIGFKASGEIQNIEVLEQKETPGLGTKMKDEKFLAQFRDKNPSTYNLKVKKDGGEVDALTGATISSRAFGEATQMAFDEFMKNKENLKTPKN
ncbi:RnfABCDGE type electron transport complex subunit G [Lutibacter maritimus]|uniref:Ion-translocating oxidoreductase complex subunit G n=1 Tax=Lutibacter maritimus TaxID=593133 RepID=A0A1I6Q110_9FLAO|nr:RnfABCDGE type electron transport complex subunit G [Lutibacter maritimus]SFS46157.1 electron transport complex protein RnfG [Lutibacter maritimus]